MNSTHKISGYSSDFLDSTETNSSDASSVDEINSNGSNYHDSNAETDSHKDISSLKPYQFEPSTELILVKNRAKRTKPKAMNN